MKPVGLEAWGVPSLSCYVSPHLHPASSTLTSTLPLNELQGSESVIVTPLLPRCPCLQRLTVAQEEAGIVLARLSQVLTLICQHICYNLRELTMASAMMERRSKDADLILCSLTFPSQCPVDTSPLYNWQEQRVTVLQAFLRSQEFQQNGGGR